MNTYLIDKDDNKILYETIFIKEQIVRIYKHSGLIRQYIDIINLPDTLLDLIYSYTHEIINIIINNYQLYRKPYITISNNNFLFNINMNYKNKKCTTYNYWIKDVVSHEDISNNHTVTQDTEIVSFINYYMNYKYGIQYYFDEMMSIKDKIEHYQHLTDKTKSIMHNVNMNRYILYTIKNEEQLLDVIHIIKIMYKCISKIWMYILYGY